MRSVDFRRSNGSNQFPGNDVMQEAYYSPVARVANVSPRLELAVRPQQVVALDWDRIESAARAGLVQLADDVRKREPTLLARQLSVRGGAAKLFVHCTLSLPSRAPAESIVVGVTVTQRGDGFLVTGDACGEDSGQVHFEVQPEAVQGAVDLAVAAATVAARLGRRIDDVLRALQTSEEA